VRRIAAVILLCLGITVAGAVARPAPKSTPTPSPAPAATLQPTSLPIVVVFPFGVSTDMSADNGQKAANLFVQVMNSAGGIDTIDAPATVTRDDYLKYAQRVNADYYVSGYMTPLGTGVSLVEQVVSTRSGAMLFGQTAQIQSFEDASAQAIAIHDGIMNQIRGMQQQYQEAQASSTPTPLPSGQANIGRGLEDIAGLFHRAKGKTRKTTVAAVKPPKGILVARVNGSVPSGNLSSATSELYSALNSYYNVRMTNSPGINLSNTADSLCGSARNNTIATGLLSAKTERHGLVGIHTNWTFTLDVYTCWGAKLDTETATAGSPKDAIGNAVTSYAASHPQNS
jgi:TolB-like protein